MPIHFFQLQTSQKEIEKSRCRRQRQNREGHQRHTDRHALDRQTEREKEKGKERWKEGRRPTADISPISRPLGQSTAKNFTGTLGRVV